MTNPLFSFRLTHLLVIALTLLPTSQAQAQWQTISEHVEFLQQPTKLRFYDSNQTLIKGDHCALMFDASGNFSAVEATIEHLKQTLNIPLCYLVASHFHDDHLLGMAVLQHYYPNAKLITHDQLAAEYPRFQQAFNDKLDSYEQSIELSFQRLAEQPKDKQSAWRDKLELAKTRLLRWRAYSLQPPEITVSDTLTLDLGNYPITINAYQAHTDADLMLYAEQNTILVGGDIVDYLPYPGHGNLSKWRELLSQLNHSTSAQIILPGHGAKLSNNELKQPLAFLTAIQQHVTANPEQDLTQLQQSFDQRFAKQYITDEISQKAYVMFLQAGLKRAKQSK
ncbi:MBL fold metallo-hydrolase [Pseudoalteromonas shioyasakiensis]|uniref:MBL fold metallo-hydrolase n=1 Tax=Pseudoalteromonas shioyasakiensis TaxID=1190813 RepID=UPI0021185DEB|nr:MBL fold metallo-hydrolase [Pseudoalteromonas shioyasakiensis]MCQ8879396.1 MBL fold metallo-hydrolase [Pseudoalteromonas shioyasakiensis]